MYATPASVAAAVDHAQKIVNAAARHHEQVVARIQQLHPIAGEALGEYTSYRGEVHDLDVAFGLIHNDLHEALGVDRPAQLAASGQPQPMIDRHADREQGIRIGALAWGTEKKRAKTEAFPLEITPRSCYEIEITAWTEGAGLAKIKVTAFPTR